MKSSSKHDLYLRFLNLDLRSLYRVKEAADTFPKLESRLHVVINNAGLGFGFDKHEQYPLTKLVVPDHGCHIQAYGQPLRGPMANDLFTTLPRR